MKRVVILLVIIIAGMVVLQVPNQETELKTAIDKSVPYVGGDVPKSLGYDGSGVVIGIIDTGISHMHPDLGGDKIIKAYNFFGDDRLSDVNGHGTEVAGIISADGRLQGMAPKAKIISYKVSDDGESVSSDLITAAIEQAVADKVDIINISLGINRTNPRIDAAVDDAVNNGIIVVVAAGNDGPHPKTIGSPGINKNAITVGATYNNVTSSMVATLDIDDTQYQVLPMLYTVTPETPSTGNVVFGGYAREQDFENGEFEGAIVIAERGSDIEGQMVYFSDKEYNAANAGAAALIIYNNEPGIYLGELIHEYVDEQYVPRIPTVSISREDGLKIRSALLNPITAEMYIFFNPDFVAGFSSRGQESPFYIKPDLVAPGAFVNTTRNDGEYNFTSGTSFAAPHVSGAAALLLQKNPGLTPDEIKSILTTTADPVSDAYGVEFGFESAGYGRLNVTRAFDANLVMSPTYLAFDHSPAKISDQRTLEMIPINDSIGVLDVEFDVPDIIDIQHTIQEDKLHITAKANLDKYCHDCPEIIMNPDDTLRRLEGRAVIKDEHATYGIPLIFRVTQGSVSAISDNNSINVRIDHPDNWTYAKIYVTDSKTGRTYTTSTVPNQQGSISVFENSTYWVEAKINVDGDIIDAFDEILVSNAPVREEMFDLDIPERQIAIAIMIAAAITITGFGLGRSRP